MGLFSKIKKGFKSVTKTLFGGDDASDGFRNAQGIIERIEIPEIRDLIFDLGTLVDSGELTPEMADTILLESTGFDDIQLDPELQRRQFQTLQRFDEIANSTGLDAQAEARFREAQDEEDQRLQGDLGAILQGAARRNEFTAGLDNVNQLISAQQSANRLADRGFDEAALAEQRALDALISSGNLSRNIEDASFDRQAQAARAQDVINTFNAQNRQNVETSNVNRANEAQRFNLGRDRERDLFNIGQRDLEEQSRVDAISNTFNRERAQARDEANLATGRGVAKQEEDDNRRSKIFDTAKDAAAVLFSDRDVKEDIKKIDTDDFLDKLTGFSFKYKGDPTEEEQIGIMAGDLRKSEFGKTLVDVDEATGFDTVDINKAIPGVLASLADMNERLKKQEGK